MSSQQVAGGRGGHIAHLDSTTTAADIHSDWEESIRRAGLRVTKGRVAVLTYIAGHPHVDAARIHLAVSDEEAGNLSLQSVHNIVRDLTEVGLLRRIGLPRDEGTGVEAARYETRTGDNHHHIRCVRCGRLEDVDCVVGEAPCLEPSISHGMRLLEAEVVFHGVCQDCDTLRP